MRAGVSHERFDDLTLRDVVEILEAESWRRRQDRVESIAAAWHFAVFNSLAKVGKLDDLESYVPSVDEGGEEQEAIELTPQQAELFLRLAGATPVEPAPEAGS